MKMKPWREVGRKARGKQGGPEGRRGDHQELILFYFVLLILFLNVLIKSNTKCADLKKKKKKKVSFQDHMKLKIQSEPNLSRLHQWAVA